MRDIEKEITLERAMIRRAAAAQRPINGSLELLPLWRRDGAVGGPVSPVDRRRAAYVSGFPQTVSGTEATWDDTDGQYERYSSG